MIRKFNYYFWRNRLLWLLAFAIWGYGNLPAIVTQQDVYTSVLESIIGVIISLIAIPIVMGAFYMVLFLANVILKIPIVVSVKEINVTYMDDIIIVTQGGTSKISKLL